MEHLGNREVAEADIADSTTLNFFGFGAMATGVKNHVFGGWLLVYYNQVMGLDAALAGLALAIALIVDAITDPLVGIWSDHTMTKWGRRHPFIYASLLPFAVSFWFLLQPPTGLDERGLFLWLLLAVIAVRVSMTFYEVPRSALGPELTKDYDQRTQMIGWTTSYGWLGGAGFAWFILAWLLQETPEYTGARAYLNPAGYASMSMFGGLVILATGLISTVGLHRHIPSFYVPNRRQRDSRKLKRLIFDSIDTLKNRSWLFLFGAGVVFALYVGLISNTDRYYDLYFWQWTPAEVQLFPLAHALVAIGSGVFAYPVTVGRDKKNTAVRLFSVCVVCGPIPMVLRLLDPLVGVQLFPGNGTDSLWWILLLHSSIMVGLSVLGFVLLGSMAADIVEQSQRHTGRRSEGLLTAGPALAQKVVSAGGLLLVGVLLSFLGFSETERTIQAMQEPIRDLATVHVVLSLSLPWISIFLLSRYTITRSGHKSDIVYVNSLSNQ